MTLVQLEYALQLWKSGNYSKAAEFFNISQPALTLQIQHLEQEVDFCIFDRNTKPISVTPLGKSFLEKAQLVMLSFNQLKDFATELNDDTTGIIVIGIIPTLAPYLTPLFIPSIQKAYPTLTIHIKELLTEQILDELNQGNIHAGIIATPIHTKSKYQIAPLFYERFLIYVSYQHELFKKLKIKIQDLPIQDLWFLQEGNCFTNQVNRICQYLDKSKMNRNFYYESNSIQNLCSVVETEKGITLIPELSSIHLSEEKMDMVKNIEGKNYVREISLLTKQNQARTKVLEKIKQIVLQNIPKRMLSIKKAEVLHTNVIS